MSWDVDHLASAFVWLGSWYVAATAVGHGRRASESRKGAEARTFSRGAKRTDRERTIDRQKLELGRRHSCSQHCHQHHHHHPHAHAPSRCWAFFRQVDLSPCRCDHPPSYVTATHTTHFTTAYHLIATRALRTDLYSLLRYPSSPIPHSPTPRPPPPTTPQRLQYPFDLDSDLLFTTAKALFKLSPLVQRLPRLYTFNTTYSCCSLV